MSSTRSISTAMAAAVTFIATGCASPSPAPPTDSTVAARRAALSCGLPSNCVDSLGGGSFAPLAYAGEPAQALAALQATLATFPEATLQWTDALGLEAIFTTPVGFRDQVDFRIDPARGVIDYRSRSLLGLFDFGKNRSRMREFIARFEKQAQR